MDFCTTLISSDISSYHDQAILMHNECIERRQRCFDYINMFSNEPYYHHNILLDTDLFFTL